MKTEMKIKDITVDNIDLVSEELKKGDNLQIMLYPDQNEEFVGFWIEHEDRNKPCTIMLNLSKEESLFLGQSLIALSKSI